MTKQIIKQSLGLDVGKEKFSACLCQREQGREFRILSNRTFECNADGFRKLHQWVKGQRAAGVEFHVLMEATGVYYEDLAYFLKGSGYRVSVLVPHKTSAYSKSLDCKTKTDKADAKKLAQMAIERDLPVWEPPSDKMLQIKRLCRERGELLEEKVAVSNRIHAKNHSHKPEKSSLKRGKELLKFILKHVREVEQAIRDAVAEVPDIQERIEKLCTIPGIGFITATTIVSETNGFYLFKNKAQLVSYAGYDVVENQSGSSVHGITKISKRGNSRIRKALHFPALVAVKKNPALKNVYDRIFDRTKIKMKGYVAIQRKLLVLIYSIYKSNQAFDPNHQVEKTVSPSHN